LEGEDKSKIAKLYIGFNNDAKTQRLDRKSKS
jgi:hypothetical protein